LIEYIDSI